MTARWRLGLARLLAVIPFVPGVAGCAFQFRHLDGSPFTPLGPPVSFDGGWLVVDSGARGMHALVEMQVATPPSDAGALGLGLVAFRLARTAVWTTGRSRVEGPRCWCNGLSKPGAAAGPPHDQTDQSLAPALPHCFYVVRAEFDLDRRPEPGDSLAIAAGGRTVQLTWR
jgi:hypothetical protein